MGQQQEKTDGTGEYQPDAWQVVVDQLGYESIHETDEDGRPGDLVAHVYGDNVALVSSAPRLRKALTALLAIAGTPNTDSQGKVFAEARAALAAAPASGDTSGYQLAFYELAKLMGIGARPHSPGQVWRNEMLPRLIALLAAAPAFPEPASNEALGRGGVDEEMLGALEGLIRYADAVRMTAGMGSNQLARLNEAKAIVAARKGPVA